MGNFTELEKEETRTNSKQASSKHGVDNGSVLSYSMGDHDSDMYQLMSNSNPYPQERSMLHMMRNSSDLQTKSETTNKDLENSPKKVDKEGQLMRMMTNSSNSTTQVSFHSQKENLSQEDIKEKERQKEPIEKNEEVLDPDLAATKKESPSTEDGDAPTDSTSGSSAPESPESSAPADTATDSSSGAPSGSAPSDTPADSASSTNSDSSVPTDTPGAPAEAPPPVASSPADSAGGTSPAGGGMNEQGGAPVAGEKSEIATPELPTESSSALVKKITQLPASQMIKGMSVVSEPAAQAKQNEQKSAIESLPVIEQPTGLSPTVENKQEAVLPEKVTPDDIQVNENQGVPEVVDPNVPTPVGPVPGSTIPKATSTSMSSPDQLYSAVRSLPSSDAEIDTSPGVAPEVPLSGDTDVNQNEQNRITSEGDMQANKLNANSAINQDFGENNMYPTIQPETIQSSTEFSAPVDWMQQSSEEIPEMDPKMLSALDPQLQAEHQAQIDEQVAKQNEAQSNFEAQSEAEQTKGMTEIDSETLRITEQQREAQQQGKKDVDDHRTTWEQENEAVFTQFKDDASASQRLIDGQIQDKVKTTNKDVADKYQKAEKDARKKQSETTKAVNKEKKKAEDKEPSWFDRAVNAVSDFFNDIKEAVNKLFDELRKAVKRIIEEVKSLAVELIDKATKFVTGLIKKFAEGLKKLVTIALAAFPDIAKKINNAIDWVVEKTVDAINRFAEDLKNIVTAIIDAIGAAIDAYLAAYQAIINAVLSALEFITVGMLKILKGLANLAKGFASMPSHFMGEMSREALGTDVTSPLENIERTSEEEALFRGESLPAMSDASMEEITGLPSIATKSELSDDDVELPAAPLELSPELLAQLSSLPEGPFELGGAGNDAVTTSELQESLFGAGDATAPIQEAGAGQQMGSMEGEEGGASPDFAGMTDDQKLQYYIDQMGQTQGMPDSKDASPAPKQSDIPLVAKTGPLSVGQRMGFAGKQMLKGMSMWWQANKWTVYAAMAGILVTAGIVAFFTGGAGLMGLIGLLMKAMTAYFIASAIVRIKGKLGEFFSLSWNGQTDAGGKSLAAALAILISEFVFEYVLKAAGKVLKRIKKAIKATKGFQKVSKGVSRGVSRVKNGVKKVTKRVKNRLGKTAIVKKGKIVINKIKKASAKNAKSFRELKERLLNKFGFKRIWFEIKGKRWELWGKFNAKVRLGKGNTEDIPDAQGKVKTKKITKNQTNALDTSKTSSKLDDVGKGGAKQGNYAPDRELPRDKHGNPIPDADAAGPHTQLGRKRSRKGGTYTQGREFDADGKPVKDIDFTDHGRPNNHTNPHQHRYIPNETGGTPKRGSAEPLMDDFGKGGAKEAFPEGFNKMARDVPGKWYTEPKNLNQKLALQEAMGSGGLGTRKSIMGKMDDARLKNTDISKMAYNRKIIDPKTGKVVDNIEIHYLRDNKTGQTFDYKFKE